MIQIRPALREPIFRSRQRILRGGRVVFAKLDEKGVSRLIGIGVLLQRVAARFESEVAQHRALAGTGWAENDQGLLGGLCERRFKIRKFFIPSLAALPLHVFA